MATGESTVFIEFMLSAIKDALIEAVETTDATQNMTDNELRLFKIEQYLQGSIYTESSRS